MRPGLLLTLIFVALAGIAIVLAAGAGWVVVSSGAFAEPQPVLLVGSVALLAFLLALIIAWVLMQLRLIRPLETITREVETLAHAKKLRPMEIPDGHTTGGLVDALHGLIAKFIAARQETGKAVEEATQRGDRYKKRLEAILLDMSEGVIVCNLDNRILLYNKAAIRILKKAGALGLGRRLFGLFEREPILAALDDLIAKQRADTTQKLSIRRQVTCTRLDKSAALKARLALICTDEVETEGYVLTFIEADAGADEEDVLPPRPEFYNFDLFKRQPEREVTEIPLKELRCVVFDTETTGLQPSKGDELVSIGAVRVVNGRIVSGETFEQLINPGKKIPKTSIKFHGITDADIKDEPSAKEVLPRFHTFVGRAVLVAHNAAFDMKFLEMKERQSGVSFTSPVLDILLLSAFLHDHASDQSLAATAERLGVDISARHTALGDAMTTARIFLALLDPLHARGVITLGDAFDISEKMVKIRKQQANF